jgi:glutamyl-tRNA reductase
LIQALQTQVDTWRQAELIRARKLIAKGGSVEEALDALARGLTQKMLHGALAELHNADLTQRAQMSDAVSRLFLRGDLRVDRGAARTQGANGGHVASPSTLADQVGNPVDASIVAAVHDAERRRA